jgi:hypothetical protein
MAKGLELEQIIHPESLAQFVANTFLEWDSRRNGWVQEKQEIRNYVFAVDTSTTSTNSLPWKNSTHIPKLCQIRDNLHANYMAALFPNDRPISWEGADLEAERPDKRRAIEAYMNNKMALGNFRTTVSRLVLDWIDYGNCFATVDFIDEKTTDALTGEVIQGFVGPKIRRISPLDIVFDPTCDEFETAPKIIRSIRTLSSLKSDIEDRPGQQYLQEAFDEVIAYRHQLAGMAQADVVKNTAYQVDGFSSFMDYFTSDYVEVLEYFGNIYDPDSGELMRNYVVTVVDRCKVIRKVPNPSWLGSSGVYHCGWRLRPDNLWAMGPLDNLIGMQYRIDHLENAKADGYDLIIQPVLKVKGQVEDFNYGPGERIYTGDDGDVVFERPDTTMLTADTQIAIYEQKMEELAGAPKQAMGFRTPGEKTAFEVQMLENGANRVFINKTSYFEEAFLERAINGMLEAARRNLSPSDLIRVMDDDIGVVEFLKVTREDITAKGRIRPVGARHFARNATIVQNLSQLSNTPLMQDPGVLTHISGKKIAKLLEEVLDLDRFGLVQDNIRVLEQMETQRQLNSAQQILAEETAPENPNAMVSAPTGQGPAGPV